MNTKSKKGCGCVGGCCGIVVIIFVIFITSLIAGGFWLKTRYYLEQPEKINKLASEICDYKLPDEFKPMIGADFNVIRFALFVKGDESKNQDASMVIFFDTSITNIADYFDEITSKIILSSDNGNEMKVKTIDFDSFMNNDTKISRREQVVYIEEEDRSYTIYKGSFPNDDRIVIAWYMAVGVTNTPADARAIINSIGKP